MLRLVLLLAVLALAVPAGAAVTSIKPIQTWSGVLRPGVPSLFQSSIATAADLTRIWTLCEVKGEPPKVDFARRIVVVATGSGSVVKFGRLTLDNGTLKTDLVVSPDMPGRQTCVLALVDRARIKTVNGVPVGK